MNNQNDGKNIFQELTERYKANLLIDQELYTTHKVYRGLRDLNGVGVVAGLTKISTINATKTVDGKRVPCEGKLYYRGIDVEDLCHGFLDENRMGFEESIYLLLFGKLPDSEELAQFCKLLAKSRTLPKNFVRDVIMKASGKDMMNSLSRGILTLASYDKYADNTEISNVLRQSIQLISVMPMLAVYSYHSFNHYTNNRSLYIHRPKENLSTAENILRMLRADKKYTPLEAKILDLALVLHMDHGGGNNSSFTTHVVSSSGTDTYSAITAALCSLKGPKHGGANIKVMEMFADLKKHVKNTKDAEQVADYLRKLLHKEAFDRKGLIYGMGHAVYSISDPRAVIFKSFVEQLSKEKED